MNGIHRDMLKLETMKFKLVSDFKPTGDQPQAIEKLTKGVLENYDHQVLLGVTGSGKTFTMANVIEKIQKPTLIISHNKTLAGQLYQEFRDFFPDNAVCYFVSYYDYYQPEAYIPQSDTYIEKEVQINEEIDKLRLAATTNLLTRKDVIVVASVSCIYNLGSPLEYGKFVLELAEGVKLDQKSILVRLADLQYDRNDYGFTRGSYRVRGEDIDLFPAYLDLGLRISVKNGRIEKLTEFDPLTGDVIKTLPATVIYPAKHYMTNPATYKDVFPQIRNDLAIQVAKLKSEGKELEAHRLSQRTNFDLEMIQEVGYVNGVENYSRYFDGRKPGEPPYSLLEYFKASSDDFLTIIDESHITVPQIRGMYNGDQARKKNLIDYGFRLPSALDNRPLKFEEFMRKINQAVYVSATPNEYELSLAKQNDAIVEQLIRPTGLVDPVVSIRPTKGQIEDLISEIEKRVKKKQRVLVTTLTKRMAEDLTSYLEERDIKISYLHSDIETLKRQDVLDNLRRGDVDVLVGINLLREGLDLPEVALVAILDADKEGFLRSRSSLIQTMGRAARNVDSQVLMYADVVTGSMKEAMDEVERRREVQLEYNKKHNITPRSIEKIIRERMVEEEQKEEEINYLLTLSKKEVILPDEKEKLIKRLTIEMREAAKELDFETATILRDQIRQLKR
jgi:excinuclease ABC subunit B